MFCGRRGNISILLELRNVIIGDDIFVYRNNWFSLIKNVINIWKLRPAFNQLDQICYKLKFPDWTKYSGKAITSCFPFIQIDLFWSNPTTNLHVFHLIEDLKNDNIEFIWIGFDGWSKQLHNSVIYQPTNHTPGGRW